MQTILAFIFVFGLIVFFHELGHFIFAKRAGILVREFAIGMGPKIFGMTKGETLYTIRLLPLGKISIRSNCNLVIELVLF